MLSSYDSIGFNWFAKSHLPTSFYMLREQSTPGRKGLKGENAEDLIADLKHPSYQKTTLLIVDMKDSSNAWRGKRGWVPHIKLFNNEGIILREKYYRFYKEQKYELFYKLARTVDPVKNYIMYSTCSISLALHLANWFRYKNVIFAGIDLYDHRYFWLPSDVLREHTRRSRGKRTLEGQHFTAQVTIKMIATYKVIYPEVNLYVQNPKSLLADVIPVWKT